jgi:hypothetical protein
MYRRWQSNIETRFKRRRMRQRREEPRHNTPAGRHRRECGLRQETTAHQHDRDVPEPGLAAPGGQLRQRRLHRLLHTEKRHAPARARCPIQDGEQEGFQKRFLEPFQMVDQFQFCPPSSEICREIKTNTTSIIGQDQEIKADSLKKKKNVFIFFKLVPII